MWDLVEFINLDSVGGAHDEDDEEENMEDTQTSDLNGLKHC